MKKLLVLVMMAVMTGCSSANLHDAIGDSGHEGVKVLYQDDENQIVIFASDDFKG
ncbi:hypothetical protein [Bacillus sp. FJAT-18017]|uniref:hypothetical protein n=1 Tax=Bacillus sp. FJAT-18017 TaxID=1705566 RepID=UPI000B1CE3DF|nr:hypothetical protein [Bacillus sp. FJAT-18017]